MTRDEAIENVRKSRNNKWRCDSVQEFIEDLEALGLLSFDEASECHCGRDGHALNSINCPVHGRKLPVAHFWDGRNVSDLSHEELLGAFGEIAGCYSRAMSSLIEERTERARELKRRAQALSNGHREGAT